MNYISKKINNRGMGLIKVIFFGFIIILILSYFKINIKTIVESPDGQSNINYVKGTSMTIWEAYLEKPLSYLWNDVFKEIFWKSFISNMERIRDGKPTDYELAAPVMPNQRVAP